MTLDQHKLAVHVQNVENLFLMALNFFDERPQKKPLEFYLALNLASIELTLSDSEELILIEKIIDAIHQVERLEVPAATVLAGRNGEQVKILFGDPEYHDLIFFEVLLAP